MVQSSLLEAQQCSAACKIAHPSSPQHQQTAPKNTHKPSSKHPSKKDYPAQSPPSHHQQSSQYQAASHSSAKSSISPPSEPKTHSPHDTHRSPLDQHQLHAKAAHAKRQTHPKYTSEKLNPEQHACTPQHPYCSEAYPQPAKAYPQNQFPYPPSQTPNKPTIQLI